MKKIFYVLFLLLIPFNVFAKTKVNDCYIDMTILDNGDILVKELWYINGNYSEFERVMNESDIELINVGGITVDRKFTYDYIYKEKKEFVKTENEIIHSDGTYEYKNNIIQIYEPAKYSEAFYIEYLIKNKIILYKDYADLNLQISNNLYDINFLEAKIKLENNNKLKIYPLFSSNIKKISNNEVKIKLSKLSDKYEIRLLFNPNIIKKDKLNEEIGLTLPSYKETILEKLNMENELTEKDEKKIYLILIIAAIWSLGSICMLIYYLYIRLSKIKYNKIPSKDDPSVVYYLLNRKINSKSLISSIISMVSEQKIILEKNNEYILKRGKSIATPLDDKILKFLFENENQITIKKIEEKIKNFPLKIEEELGSYSARVILESKINEYEKTNISTKIFKVIFSFIGLILGILILLITYQKTNIFYLGLLICLWYLILIIINLKYHSRTSLGKDICKKWKGFKKSLKKYNKILENKNISTKIYSYSIALGVNKHLSQIWDMKEIDLFIKQFEKKLSKSINKYLKKAHKFDSGTSSEDTTKIKYRKEGEENEENI